MVPAFVLSLITHPLPKFVQSQLEKLGVIYLYPQTGFSEENLKAYLQTPPTGNYGREREGGREDMFFFCHEGGREGG